MQKIPTLYERNPENRSEVIMGQVTPGCEWVLAGEGVATRKWDGTCVMLDENGRWWNRREIRPGKKIPEDAIDLGEDPNTGKHMVWVPNTPAGFQKFLHQAIDNYEDELKPGTYELCGPKIDTRAGQNPEGLSEYVLKPHGADVVETGTPEQLITRSREEGWEGIVWHHPDGRRAKLKVRDIPAEYPLVS